MGSKTNTMVMSNDHAADSETQPDGRPLESYEWAGGILAGLGFFMSPFLTAGPASFFAWKLRKERRFSAIMIVTVLMVAGLFWVPFLLSEGPVILLSLAVSGAVIALLTLVVAGLNGHLN